MTLSALLADLYDRTNYGTAPAASVTTRFTRWLNLVHRAILTQHWASRLRDDTLTFASVANQAVYALPPAVAKIEHVHDRTNRRPLAERDLGWLRQRDPGLSQIGGPAQVYIPRGIQPVAVQPSAAAEIFIVSTAAGDTNLAYLEGIRTGGYPVSLGPITMTGVTAKSFSTTITDLIEITKLYLSVAAVGTVTVHSVSGAGVELARIPIGQTFARYLGIQLWPTPSDVTTYHIDYVRVIPDLIVATDEPLLPADFHDLLVEGALLKEWTKKDDTRRQAAQADYEAGLRDLRSWVLSNPDTVASLRRTHHSWSNLGPSYPADESWGGY